MSLFYKTKDTADIAQKNIHEFQKGDTEFPVLKSTDDFGHIVTIHRDNLSHAVYIDHEKTAQLGPPPGQGQRIPASGIPGARNAPLPPVEVFP